MAIEVERKVRSPHEPVIVRLQQTGYRRIERVVQTDVYLDAPHRSFAATDEALRIRYVSRPEGGDASTWMTYKGPRHGEEHKARREIDAALSDPAAMRAILSALDFSAVETVEKERVTYERGRTIVALDTVVGLGEFVEVETMADGGDLANAEAVVQDAVDELALTDAEAIDRTYLGLLLDDSSQ